MRLKILCLAALALAVGQSSAVAGPLAQTGAATTAAPSGIQLAQSDDRRDRRRARRGGNSRSGGGDGVYTGGRGGDGVYTGGRSGGGNGVYTGGRSRRGDGVYTGGSRSRRGDGVYTGGGRGTVFCNPSGVCVRDLNKTPGAGLGD